MWLAVIVIGVISAVVIAGTAFLALSKAEELPEGNKVKILLVVGVVVFISFAITTFKHRDLTISNQQTSGLDFERVFFGGGRPFQSPHRHSSLQDIPAEHVAEVHRRNYVRGADSSQMLPQRILYLSGKDQGASMFLANLASKLCQEEQHPVVYLKLQRPVVSEQELSELIGVSSYEQLERGLCHLGGWSVRRTQYGVEYHKQSDHQGKMPYFIIDNFQHILSTLVSKGKSQLEEREHKEDRKLEISGGHDRLMVRVISELMTGCGINVILNTQKQAAVQLLYDIWEDMGRREGFPFEFHQWSGLNQYDIYQIISKSVPESQNLLAKLLDNKKKPNYTFRDLDKVLQEARTQKEASQGSIKVKVIGGDELGLAESQTKLEVAKYYSLESVLKEVRRSDNRRVGWVKSRVPWAKVDQLQSLGLIDIRNGEVVVK